MLWPVVLTLAAFLTNSYAFTAEEDKVPAVPSVLREFNDRILRAEAYHNLPWSDLANFNFFPREFFAQPPSLETPDLEDYDGTSPGGEEEDDLSPTRTSTASKAVFARSTFTFICPTSVQCNDGGCCPLGDYCALRNGQEGCCPLGSLCDASPIPGCSVSCYGTCCDTVPNIIGEPVCSPTPGAGGQASGTCTGVAPSNPLYTLPGPSSCLAGEFFCGHECCPGNEGLICDNVTIPDQPFCNLPADVCPPGSRRRRIRQAGSESSSSDDCLATTDPAAFTDRVTTNGTQGHTASPSTTSMGMPVTTSTNSASAAASTSASASQSSGAIAPSSLGGSVSVATASSGAFRSTVDTAANLPWLGVLSMAVASAFGVVVLVL